MKLYLKKLSELPIDDCGRYGQKVSLFRRAYESDDMKPCMPEDAYVLDKQFLSAFLDESTELSSCLSELTSANSEALKDYQGKLKAIILDASFDISHLLNWSDADNDYLVYISHSEEHFSSIEIKDHKPIIASGIEAILSSIKSIYCKSALDDRVLAKINSLHKSLYDAIPHLLFIQLPANRRVCGKSYSYEPASGYKGVCLTQVEMIDGSVQPSKMSSADEYQLLKSNLLANKPSILSKKLGFRGSGETSLTGDAGFILDDKQCENITLMSLMLESQYINPCHISWVMDVHGKYSITDIATQPDLIDRNNQIIERYLLKEHGEKLCEGRSVGHKVAYGSVRLISCHEDLNAVRSGDIIVADMIQPSWEPYISEAAGFVTQRGGRTCHAAIMARELGIPAIVGCGDVMDRLSKADDLTVSCAEGDRGTVYKGKVAFSVDTIDADYKSNLPINMMLNVANPHKAYDYRKLPNQGVGLARLEFIINRMIGIHPKALLDYDALDDRLKKAIDRRSKGYESATDFYVKTVAQGIATIAAAFESKPVILRFSDFKSNEYSNLIGGHLYEPQEENPTLGLRGVSRYLADEFRGCFDLECESLQLARETLQLTNIHIMLPFCRTPHEAKLITAKLAEYNLVSSDTLKVYMMCEVPSNILLADEFLDFFDGYCIGASDLTQLTLGVDRDSALVSHLFDERSEAVKTLLSQVFKVCKRRGKYIGYCGQLPLDTPDFYHWLVESGVDSISLSPDVFLDTLVRL